MLIVGLEVGNVVGRVHENKCPIQLLALAEELHAADAGPGAHGDFLGRVRRQGFPTEDVSVELLGPFCVVDGHLEPADLAKSLLMRGVSGELDS